MTGPAAAARVIHLLVIGRSPDSNAALQTYLSTMRPGLVVDWSTALHHVPQAGTPPDVIVLLQEHPEQYSQQQVRDLLNACPLSRLIVSYSPWCASDGRTRQLWPDACRVPEAMLVPRLRRELAVISGELLPLPLTADRDECWVYDFAAGPASVGRQLAVAVSTPDPDIGRWLEEALTMAGFRIANLSEAAAEVLLFDADPWTAQRAAALASIRRQQHLLPIVALVGYPRTAEQQALLEAGASSVVSKLAPSSEWCHAIAEATAAPRDFRPDLNIVTDL